MLTQIDAILNKMTMYKVALYELLALALLAILFGFTGTLHYSGAGLAASAVLLFSVCYGANYLFAKLFGAAANAESSYITGLILFCIFSPPNNVLDGLILAVVGVVAMGLKYVVAYRARHLFNPAALAAFVVGLIGLKHASWWIATDVMMPFVLLGGLLVVRKLRRFHMLLAFLIPAAIGVIAVNIGDRGLIGAFTDAFMAWPLLFLGTVMLTEPLTTPPIRRQRILYGVLVGLLVGFAPYLHVGSVHMAPELALLIGNAFAYATTMRKRLPLTLIEKREVAPGIYHFRFKPRYLLRFTPGQYMDVTLPHKSTDVKGNRRSFSIAAAPAEGEIAFGVRIPQAASSFKAALLAMQPGDHLYGVQVAGDFTLPPETSRKVAYIAGGIGVTPFRSIVRHQLDTGAQRDAVLLYQATDPAQFAYRELFEQASTTGLRTLYILAGGKPEAVPADWGGETGFITPDMLTRHVPDIRERTVYVSGPPAMVDSYKTMLRRMGVPRGRIVADHFSGY